MSPLKPFKSTELLAFLIALLELQLFAVEAKRKCVASAAQKYLNPDLPWLDQGICDTIRYTPSALTYSDALLCSLFQNAPINHKGYDLFPVPSPFSDKSNCAMYGSPAYVMWGDHPYADNRRQLISEMIDQLQTELTARCYKL